MPKADWVTPTSEILEGGKADWMTPTSLEMDDAALGRFVRAQAQRLGDNKDGLAISVVAAGGVLIACCVLTGGIKLSQPMPDQKIVGKPVGDWLITVERVSP